MAAQTALTLDHVTRGRAIIGLGSGEQQQRQDVEQRKQTAHHTHCAPCGTAPPVRMVWTVVASLLACEALAARAVR